MAEFVMPALGADMSAGRLIAWRKGPGDVVSRGDIIAEVHTDKADIEVEVFTSGVIEKLLVEPGEQVPVGTPLALIRENGKAPEKVRVPKAAPPAAAAAPEAAHALASPSAKHLAEELGVDLAAIAGSGPGGRIQRRDIEQAAAAAAAQPPPAPPAAAPAAPAAPAPPPAEAGERQAAMRRAIAAAMARSKREVPHFYLSETIDMSRVVAWLAQENLRRPVPDRLLHGVLLLKAVALALREVPELNATWQGEQVVQSEGIHLGVAIFLRGGGLVAPALHDADQQNVDELMRNFRDLVTRARAWSLRSSEMSDPTITVTSLGERGAESVLPIIFPPQVAIVGFGRLVERPWISDGQILPCPLVQATLAADHRVTDGHRAGAFLNALQRLLEEPEDL
ncbi:MAG TPA: dihydrolipoamide acetyltransferase family protein [Gaiellaceae bacterium]|nr:dihydrolipoamide acetyltransferase family protein [Gaiellaceae bacterium]